MAGPDLSGYYAQVQADANAAYERAKASIQNNRVLTRQQYGFNPDGSLDSNNKYGYWQRNQKQYGDQVLDAQDQYGITVGSDGKSYTVDPNSNGQLASLGRARTNTIFDSGMNEDGTLGTQNQYGGYQRLLGQEAGELSQAEDASRARGLTGKGLGAQGAQQLRFQQAGDQQDFRTQLTRTLAQNTLDRQSTTKGIDRSLGDIAYNKDVSNYDLTNSLNQSMNGYDQQDQQALYDRNQTLNNGYLQDILNQITTGNFTPASADLSDGAQAGAPAPGAPKSFMAKPAQYGSYNPAAYVPGGASPAVAAAIQRAGYGARPLPNAYLTNPNKRG